MIKKSLAIVALTHHRSACSVDTVAFAGSDFTHLCVAAADLRWGKVYIGAASTTPLAATGSGLDVGAWVSAGIAILIVGLAFTLLPARRAAAVAGGDLRSERARRSLADLRTDASLSGSARTMAE